MVINQKVKYNEETLTLLFSALADPTRRDIIEQLRIRDRTVNELAAYYNMSLPAVSKHLKLLENAGIISTTKDAQFRRKRLCEKSFNPLTEWLSIKNINTN